MCFFSPSERRQLNARAPQPKTLCVCLESLFSAMGETKTGISNVTFHLIKPSSHCGEDPECVDWTREMAKSGWDSVQPEKGRSPPCISTGPCHLLPTLNLDNGSSLWPVQALPTDQGYNCSPSISLTLQTSAECSLGRLPRNLPACLSSGLTARPNFSRCCLPNPALIRSICSPSLSLFSCHSFGFSCSHLCS